MGQKLAQRAQKSLNKDQVSFKLLMESTFHNSGLQATDGIHNSVLQAADGIHIPQFCPPSYWWNPQFCPPSYWWNPQFCPPSYWWNPLISNFNHRPTGNQCNGSVLYKPAVLSWKYLFFIMIETCITEYWLKGKVIQQCAYRGNQERQKFRFIKTFFIGVK